MNHIHCMWRWWWWWWVYRNSNPCPNCVCVYGSHLHFSPENTQRTQAALARRRKSLMWFHAIFSSTCATCFGAEHARVGCRSKWMVAVDMMGNCVCDFCLSIKKKTSCLFVFLSKLFFFLHKKPLYVQYARLLCFLSKCMRARFASYF